MKTFFSLCCGAVLGLSNVDGQATNAAPGKSAPPPPPPAPAPTLAQDLSPTRLNNMARFQTEMVTQILGVRLNIDGPIPRMVRLRRPLQMINPLAPPEYGTGLDNVSTDPHTGRMDGISLFRIKF